MLKSSVFLVDWVSLPPELVESIGKKLTVHADYIRFRAVCRAWRSCTERMPKHLPCQLTWLMLPVVAVSKSKKVKKSDPCDRSFFDIASNKIHRLSLPGLSHLTRLHRICGSCDGWIVIAQYEKSPSIFIFNPLNGERVDLPSLSSFPDVFFDIDREYGVQYWDDLGLQYECAEYMWYNFIGKIVLSGTPVSGSFVAVVISIRNFCLAYCKSGENSWKYIKETISFAEDVTYLNGLFYSINNYGQIAVCDFDGDSPAVNFILEFDMRLSTLNLYGIPRGYLVNSMGMLLLVNRIYSDCVGRFVNEIFEPSDCTPSGCIKSSTSFEVFKFDFCQQNWVEMTSLGDMVLFVGLASSLALKASDFPGYKGNKIYFLDHDSERGNHCRALEEVGIFDLDDRSVHRLACSVTNSDSSNDWPLPVWITPILC